jgi:tryptophanyl-tRNA synthetase
VTRVFSGIQPTGQPHLGNYLGALKNWVAMQERADTVYCVVDLHAVTTPYSPQQLRAQTVEMATSILAVGVDPDRSLLFVQSHVPEHTEMTWLFNCVAGFGELGRMPQFKEKSERAAGTGDSVSVGLFDYPVLQTADILLYHAGEVPVGEDQRHHIELARDLGQRFNHRFDREVFTLPESIHPEAAARVMDLQNPTDKMSKSAESPKGLVLLFEEPKRIAKKIRSAVTDSGTEVRYDREHKAGISNLIELMAAATDRSLEEVEAEFVGAQYGTFKTAVAEAVVEMCRPFRERYLELEADPAAVEEILTKGADEARSIAADTLAAAKDAMGFWTP